MTVSVPRSLPFNYSRNLRSGGFLGMENKFLDVSLNAGVAIPAPTDCTGGEMQPDQGCTGCLSSPAQGDGSQNREGKQIIINKIFISGCVAYTVQQDKTDPFVCPTVWVALVLDTQANAATISSENVFTNPSGVAVCNVFPFRNLENTSRYRVLAHKTIHPGQTLVMTDHATTSATMSCDANNKHFTMSWKGKLKVNFKTTVTTANVSGVVDNALHLVAFASSSTNSLPATMFYNSRIRFTG